MRYKIIISNTEKILMVIVNGETIKSYPISLAKNGLGNIEGSGKTPTGEHEITDKIGEKSEIGTIFSSRIDTGKVWQKTDEFQENLILTRIIRIRGLEKGINLGGTVDSYNRYIYIHGTNCEDDLGINNVSHGCILMKNSDIIELFDIIKEGDIVTIS